MIYLILNLLYEIQQTIKYIYLNTTLLTYDAFFKLNFIGYSISKPL